MNFFTFFFFSNTLRSLYRTTFTVSMEHLRKVSFLKFLSQMCHFIVATKISSFLLSVIKKQPFCESISSKEILKKLFKGATLMYPDKQLSFSDKSQEVTFQIKYLSEHILITSSEHQLQINLGILFYSKNKPSFLYTPF